MGCDPELFPGIEFFALLKEEDRQGRARRTLSIR